MKQGGCGHLHGNTSGCNTYIQLPLALKLLFAISEETLKQYKATTLKQYKSHKRIHENELY